MSTLVGFLGYLAIIAAIGVYALRRTKTTSDYVIGARSLSAPVAALSAGASDMSGWLLLGLPGAVFVAGLGEAWIVVGLVCGAWANWHLVAERLRTFTEGLGGAVTLPQFFARRVQARTQFPAVVATLLVLFFFAVYVAAGLSPAPSSSRRPSLGLCAGVVDWRCGGARLYGARWFSRGELDRLLSGAVDGDGAGRGRGAGVHPRARCGRRLRRLGDCRGDRRLGDHKRLGVGPWLLRPAAHPSRVSWPSTAPARCREPGGSIWCG